MTLESSATILLVEDNPSDLELALHALRQHKLVNHIEVARDGVEALDYVFGTGTHSSRNPNDVPRVILLDLKLPKIDGLDVLRRIRADPRTKTIPVVIMTSSHEERDLIDGYEAGVNSYITKPVDFVQFTEVVRTLGFYWLLLNQSPRI